MAKRIIYTIFAPIFVALALLVMGFCLALFFLIMLEIFPPIGEFFDYIGISKAEIWDRPFEAIEFWVIYIIALFYTELKIWS